jgi:hypothetical protein
MESGRGAVITMVEKKPELLILAVNIQFKEAIEPVRRSGTSTGRGRNPKTCHQTETLFIFTAAHDHKG